MTRHNLTKAARIQAAWAGKAAPATFADDKSDIPLCITFQPPSRRIDRQNMPHLVKAYIDGLADAWGVNDKRFLSEYVYADPVRGGCVHIEVMA